MKKLFCYFILYLFLSTPVFASGNQETNFDTYMADLQTKIKSNWRPPSGIESREVIAFFKVDRAGNIYKIKILKSGGNNYDEAARMAIKLSSPFSPLPDSYEKKAVDVRFSLAYNSVGSNNQIPSRYTVKKKSSMLCKFFYPLSTIIFHFAGI